MNYKIVKLTFPQGVHFGNGMLTDGESTILADTFFSALCQEALLTEEGIDKLCSLVNTGKIRISDGMPYIGDTLYLPKPYMKIQADNESDSSVKKAFKKLSFIPSDKLEQYLAGQLDASAENGKLSTIGCYEMRNHAAINRGEDADPYHVGIFHFNIGNGLYLIIGYEKDDEWNYLGKLILALSYTGIGGRRSAGLGRFTYSVEPCPSELVKRLSADTYKTYMTLCISLPDADELNQACLDSQFILIKRSGYVASSAYAEDFLKKKDFFGIAAGSTFTNIYRGNLYDVSFKGKHPVYRYAYPMFFGIQ